MSKVILFIVLVFASCSRSDSETKGILLETVPADGSTLVPVDTEISLSFQNEVDAGTVKIQEQDGVCENVAIQISRDDFATCKGGSATVMPDDKHKVTVTPSSTLDHERIYTVSYDDLSIMFSTAPRDD